jgi:hypothetical protein
LRAPRSSSPDWRDNFFDVDPDPGSAIFSILDRGFGMEKLKSGIRDEHPGYATLLFLNTDFKWRFCCCWCPFCQCFWCSFQLFLSTETYSACSLTTRINRNFRYFWNLKLFIFKITGEPVSIWFCNGG